MLNQFIHSLEGKPKILILGVSIVSSLVLGLIDFRTGFEISFSFFYLLPVSLAAWGAGKRTGILLSLFSAIVWITANHLAGEIYLNPWIQVWNTLTRFGFFLIITLLLAELHQILDNEKQLARTDDLTQILNRRAFYESVNYELDRARRYPGPLTLIYFDVDGFKEVNDQKGHAEGDRLLMAVSNVITHQIRAADVLGRLGGDEFAILLPETDPLAAQMVVPRLQRVLLDSMQVENWPVTFSIGVLSCYDMPESAEVLISMADRLMYEIKKNGKNAINFAVYHHWT